MWNNVNKEENEEANNSHKPARKLDKEQFGNCRICAFYFILCSFIQQIF